MHPFSDTRILWRESGRFSGSGDCVSVEAIPETETLSLNVRLRPETAGGILTTGLLSLAIVGEGLVVAILGVEDVAGRMTREIPLTPLAFGTWHTLTLRLHEGILEFFLDGVLRNRETIRQRPVAVFPTPTLIGEWRVPDPALPKFPEHVVAMLYRRPFTGEIEHVACWTRALRDEEIALLHDVPAVREAMGASEADDCLAAYRAFHDASRRKDVAACESLGRAMRAFMARDPARPIYHLTAPMDGILDPAAAFYHDGEYHVFSYRNLVSLLACTPLAHFASDDMIHWKDRPIAIWPDSDEDEQGIWLANLFYEDDGTPAMLYTAHGKRGKIGMLARSRDNLTSFTDKQAVITDIVHHDGHAWRDGDTWFSLTTEQHWGTREGDIGDGILLLESPDGIRWQNRGEIFHARKHPAPMSEQQGWGFAEYPYLLSFGDRDVLMLGTRPATYWVGRFDKEIPAFVPDEPEGRLLDHLNPFHCFNPLTVDAKGPDGTPRRIVYAMHLYASGKVDCLPWYGVHTLPRVLTLCGDRLCQEPVPEVESLHGRHHHFAERDIPKDASDLLPDVSGDALRILATFLPGKSSRFGLKVRAAADGSEGTRIFFDAPSGQIRVEGNVKTPSPYPELGQAFAHLTPGAPVTIQVFLDKCLFEVFVNGQTLTGVFDTDTRHRGIALFSEGGSATLQSMDIWEMLPAEGV